MPYKRKQFEVLIVRLNEQRRFIQVLAGPRQSGKTTVAHQVASALEMPVRLVSADDPEALGRTWLEQQWEIARVEARDAGTRGSLLVIDEIQKVPAWSETVKRLWDQDTAGRVPLRILLLGSAPLPVQQGLTESLAGRFEIIRSPHWSYAEMRDAFGWSVDQYVYFGGYPGAADLMKDERRWKRYVLDSIVETTLSRDLLQMRRIDKPALLRQLFTVACVYSGQILSYTKLVGQLQDAGNTTTLAHYLELLGAAGMAVGLQKYAGQKVRQRGSSPKFQVLNGALVTCQSDLSFEQAKREHAFWGRLVESAVGAHLVNASLSEGFEVFYWRERDKEVDFVVRHGKTVTAIEVRSVPGQSALSGMQEFAGRFTPKKKLLVGGDGIPVGEFLGKPIAVWLT